MVNKPSLLELLRFDCTLLTAYVLIIDLAVSETKWLKDFTIYGKSGYLVCWFLITFKNLKALVLMMFHKQFNMQTTYNWDISF